MLAPWKKSYDKPRQHIKKQRLYLATKFHLVKAMVFPVVMYGCESWTIKKAECQKIDAFELWCWRRLLRVPWTARRSNQSPLKEINPEYSLEGLMLKLKLQYFGHLMQRANSLAKVTDAGKDWKQEEKEMTDDKMVGWYHWLIGQEFEQAPRDGVEQRSLVCCSASGHKESDTTEQLNNSYLSIYLSPICPSTFWKQHSIFPREFLPIQAQLMCFDEGGYMIIKPSHFLGHRLSTSFMSSLRVKRVELSRRITTHKSRVLVSLRNLNWSH